jgi:hypothetical protein
MLEAPSVCDKYLAQREVSKKMSSLSTTLLPAKGSLFDINLNEFKRNLRSASYPFNLNSGSSTIYKHLHPKRYYVHKYTGGGKKGQNKESWLKFLNPFECESDYDEEYDYDD